MVIVYRNESTLHLQFHSHILDAHLYTLQPVPLAPNLEFAATDLFAVGGKVSQCLPFLFGKWVHYLPLGQLRVIILFLGKVWKIERTVGILTVIILFNAIDHHTASCPLLLLHMLLL